MSPHMPLRSGLTSGAATVKGNPNALLPAVTSPKLNDARALWSPQQHGRAGR